MPEPSRATYGVGLLRPSVYTSVLAPLIFLAGIVLTRGDSRWYSDPVSYAICFAFAANPVTAIMLALVGLQAGFTLEDVVVALVGFLLTVPVSLKNISRLILPESAEELAAREEKVDAETPRLFVEDIRESLRQPVYRFLYLFHSGFLLPIPVSPSKGNSVVLSFLSACIFRSQVLMRAHEWIRKFQKHEQVGPMASSLFIASVVIGNVAMQLIERRALAIQADQAKSKETIAADAV